jgi:hypothetical protein
VPCDAGILRAIASRKPLARLSPIRLTAIRSDVRLPTDDPFPILFCAGSARYPLEYSGSRGFGPNGSVPVTARLRRWR